MVLAFVSMSVVLFVSYVVVVFLPRPMEGMG